MKLLEVMAMPNSQLSTEQKECLLRLYMNKGGPPSAAMQGLAGNAQLIAAAEYLIKAGMLSEVQGGVMVSQAGENELVSAGVIDQSGVTDTGRELLGQPPPKPKAPAQPSQPSTSNANSPISSVAN